MAAGDVTVYQEALAYMIDGDWASTDTVKIALITSATAPTAADLTPALADYTECTPGGNYASGGDALDTIANMVTQSSGTMTFDDTGASVSWAQNASNPTNARYGFIYNSVAGDGIAFVDLGAVIDMTAGDLTITWNASGIFTIA